MGVSRSRQRRVAVIAVAIALLATACGSRRSHDELLAASTVRHTTVTTDNDETAQPVDPSTGTGGTEPSTTEPVDGSSPKTETEGAAAPGSSVPSQAPTASTPAAQRQCTGNEPPLKLGSVGQLTGAVGNGVLDEVKATQAWVGAMNARGGINCFPIEYTVVDDGGDPARHQSLIRQLVERDGVVAFLTNTAALTGRASVPYVTENRIPVIGGVTGPWFYESPVFFPHAAGSPGDSPAGIMAIGEYAKLKGKTNLGVVTCTESSDCATVNRDARRYSSDAGMKLVYNGQASALQPDYTSVCQAAQRAKANLFNPVLGPAGLTRVGNSCARVNFHPLYVVPQVTAQIAMADDPNITPLGVTMPVLPWTQTNNPNIAEFRQVLAQFAPGVEPGPASIIGWVGAKLFEEATRNLAEPTSEAVLDGLWSIRNNDLGGLTVPLTFTRDQLAPGHECWWLAEGNNGKWTSPNNGARNCV